MDRVVVEQTVGTDGVLTLTVPLGAAEAGRTVFVTVEARHPSLEMTPEEWRAAVFATAGSWRGDFEFVPKELPEERNPLS